MCIKNNEIYLFCRNVNGVYRMALFALRDIESGEELCYDYNFHSYNMNSQVYWYKWSICEKNNPKKTRKTNCNLQLTLMFWSDNSFLKENRHIFLHIMVILKFYTEMEFMWLFFWRIINMRFLRFCTKYHVSMLYCLMHFNIIFNLFFSFPQNTTLLTV